MSKDQRWWIPLLVLPILGSVLACATVHGPAQLEVRHDPFEFIDKLSGQHLGEVLVVPRYSSFSGISTGAGHGLGAGRDTVYVASPFVYRSGATFQPLQPNSHGVVAGSGWAFTGKGVSLDGVLIVCPGYQPMWLWDLWDQGASRRIELTPLDQGEALEQLRLIAELLRKPVLTGDERTLWSLGGDKRITVRLTPEQAALVEDFLSAWQATLEERSNQS
ncbi:MAG: hypothetical protein ACRD88_08365 [Terriglobia bacterium]